MSTDYNSEWNGRDLFMRFETWQKFNKNVRSSCEAKNLIVFQSLPVNFWNSCGRMESPKSCQRWLFFHKRTVIARQFSLKIKERSKCNSQQQSIFSQNRWKLCTELTSWRCYYSHFKPSSNTNICREIKGMMCLFLNVRESAKINTTTKIYIDSNKLRVITNYIKTT